MNLDLMFDECLEIIAFAIWRLVGCAVIPGNALLYSTLPSSFEQYWEGVRGNARTDWRKAVKNGYSFKQVDWLTQDMNNDIMEIWDSVPTRQGRPMNREYIYLGISKIDMKDLWPIPDYRGWTCPHHNLSFWVAEKDNKVRGYIELVRIGNIVFVHSLLGHHDFLKEGIMKYLFVEVSKVCIKNEIKYLFYAREEALKKDLHFFLRDLRITTPFDIAMIPQQLKDALSKDWKAIFKEVKTPEGSSALQLMKVMKEDA